MLADMTELPGSLPPGFAYVEGEEEFDPARHLALREPDEILTLSDFGYDADQQARFPSPVAATSPARILSDEGVAALERSIELARPHMVRTPNGDARLYYGSYRSRFMRDLTASSEVIEFLSKVFSTPVVPHTMAHLGVQLNTGERAAGEIEPWHHDWVAFTAVLSMYDPTAVDGGRFEYFRGTRLEGRQLAAAGELPAGRLTSPVAPPGWAALVQGTAVWHRAAPLLRDGYRASLVLSFCTRDASYPDGNRTFLMDPRTNEYMGAVDQVSPVPVEYARHGAWLARARLATLLDELRWTDDLGFVADQLDQAIAPAQRVIALLRAGTTTDEEVHRLNETADEEQLAAPRFEPAGRPVGSSLSGTSP